MDDKEILKLFSEKLALVKNLSELNDLRVHFLGKNGVVTSILSRISQIPPNERKSFGKLINDVRSFIENQISSNQEKLAKKEYEEKIKLEKIDITLPSIGKKIGKQHILTKVTKEVSFILDSMGFSIIEGSEQEEDWYNFTALNIDELHPARQMHDTFYLNTGKLLRTHTTAVDIRHIEKIQNPICKIASIGRVYRSDYDATHTPMFHQVEMLWIDYDVNLMHLEKCLIEFLSRFFERDVKIRMRLSHFPFTEPSMEVDILWNNNKWLEILGSGVIHPKVLDSCNIDSKKYQAVAFGMGLERIAMLKYKIDDLRSFFN